MCLPSVSNSSREECFNHVLNEDLEESLIKNNKADKKLKKDIEKIDLKKDNRCKYCSKSFTHRQNKWRHEKKCVLINTKKEEENFLWVSNQTAFAVESDVGTAAYEAENATVNDDDHAFAIDEFEFGSN